MLPRIDCTQWGDIQLSNKKDIYNNVNELEDTLLIKSSHALKRARCMISEYKVQIDKANM